MQAAAAALLLLLFASPSIQQGTIRQSQSTKCETLIRLITTRDSIREMSPSLNVSDQQPLMVKAVFIGLINVDDRDRRVSFLSSTTYSWMDLRTAWTVPDECEYDSLVIFPANKIWTPWIWNENARFAAIDPYIWDQTPIKITKDGTVVWMTGAITEVVCDFDMSMYPSDEQLCNYTIRILGEFRALTEDIEMNKDGLYHPLWHINNSKTIILHERIGGLSFIKIDFRFSMKRKPDYYIYSTMLPAAVLSPLPSLCFLIPPDSGEKMSIALSTLLTYFVYSVSFFSTLPESQILSVMGILFVYQLFLSCLAAFAAAFTLQQAHSETITKKGRATEPVGLDVVDGYKHRLRKSLTSFNSTQINKFCFLLFLIIGCIVPNAVLFGTL